MTFDLAISIHVDKQILVHQQTVHPIDGQHVLNGLDNNNGIHLPLKPGPVPKICRRVKGAGKVWTITNGIICVEFPVEKIMPSALDVVQFEIMMLLQQVGRPSDPAVGEPIVLPEPRRRRFPALAAKRTTKCLPTPS